MLGKCHLEFKGHLPRNKKVLVGAMTAEYMGAANQCVNGTGFSAGAKCL